jgi:hypothetical protein
MLNSQKIVHGFYKLLFVFMFSSFLNAADSRGISGVVTTLGGESQKVLLKKGWNLLGINISLTLAELQNRIGVDNLLVIQGETTAYKKEYVDQNKEFLNDFKILNKGEGYWIRVGHDISIEYTPISRYNDSVSLSKGWNLVNPSKELSLDEIKKQLGANNVGVIQGPEKIYKKEYLDNGKEFLNDFEKFEEPKGYWINVASDSQLSFVE